MFAAFRALRNRDFAFLWTGQTVSRMGDYVYQIVIAWWVLRETGSAAVMGTVLIVTFLPVALATLVGGVVVDRLPRVPIMLASDVIRGLAVFGMASLAATGQLELWMVYVLGLLFGFSDAFFGPAYFALVPSITPADDLPSANALTSMSFQLGRVVGPALGGALVAFGGATMGLFVNAASFGVAAVLMLPLLARDTRAAPAEDGAEAPHWLDDLREGLQTVLRHPVLTIRFPVVSVAAALLVGPFLVSMPFLVAKRFGDDPRIYGFLLAVFPIGFILGSLFGGRKPVLRRRGLVIFGGFVIAGAMLALFGLPLPIAALIIAALVNGFSLEMAGLADTLVLQELVPANQLGRIASLDQLAGWLLTPLAFYVAGLATERVGPEPVFLFGGVVAAAVSLLALAHPAVLHLD